MRMLPLTLTLSPWGASSAPTGKGDESAPPLSQATADDHKQKSPAASLRQGS